jgi:6-phosphofructokinase 1
MEKRKAKGSKYQGGFNPVTHYFGYQGRSAHPSNFDCNLGSTLGFAAAALLDEGITGQAVSVKELTNTADQWRVGAVPILALLRSQPKSGYKRNELVVASHEVQLTDIPYQVYKANERAWKFIDHYCNPGPVQYMDQGCNDTTDTLEELYKTETDVADQIKGLCNSINNSTMFAEH